MVGGKVAVCMIVGRLAIDGVRALEESRKESIDVQRRDVMGLDEARQSDKVP